MHKEQKTIKFHSDFNKNKKIAKNYWKSVEIFANLW